MQPTPTPLPESADSSELSQNSGLSLSFLEAPTASLIEKPLSEWNDEELIGLVAHFRELSQVPGRVKVQFKDESVEIKTGKRPTRKKQDVKALIADLL